MSLPIYNQWGQSWSATKLGDSIYTMGDSGCYTVSITMILNNFGYKVNPQEVVDKINKSKGYFEGMVNYSAIEQNFPWVSFHQRVDTTNHPASNISKMEISEAIRKVKRLVQLGMFPILCVDNVYNDKWPDHAVVLIEAPDDTSKWLILNPDGGKQEYFEAKYGPVEKNLYGYVSLIGPAQTATDIRLGNVAWKAKEVEKACRRKDYSKAQVYSSEILDSLI